MCIFNLLFQDKNYPAVEPDDFARGAIRNLKFEGICVSSPSSGIHTYF